jgi:glutathione synthase/RimK-type ligase-like ATP-grasp enzyme
MRKIAIYFTDPHFHDSPFDAPEYKEAYYTLATSLEKKGGKVYIIRSQDTYTGGMSFSRGWEFREGSFHEHPERIKADLIFKKGRAVFDAEANIINVQELEDICTDKFKTYQLFTSLCPRTDIAQHPDDVPAILQTLSTPLVVAKPLDKEGGEGVIIDTPEKVRTAIQEFPYLIQEFIDTSGGIPGITDTKHDFRLTIIAGEIVIALLRTPKDGSYLANASQGGTITEIPLTHIPPEVLTVFHEVESKLSRFPTRFYSLDVGRDKSGQWKMIELNAQPGLLIHELKEDGKKFFDRVSDFLLAHA